jgi:hypothetical protein
MGLSALTNWDQTRDALHQAAQVVGAVRKYNAEPLPNYAHLGLRMTPDGLSSGPLAFGGEMTLSFSQQAIHYQNGDQGATTPLSGHTQMSLADAVQKMLGQFGHSLNLDRAKITHQETFAINPTIATEYAPTLYSIYSGLARFRSHLFGGLSPIVLWPHNFDISFLAFATADLSEDRLHAAFGFEPRSAGFDRPYLYAYVRPTPDGITKTPLPPLTRWHTQGWTGVVMDYDTAAQQSDPERVIERTFDGVYHALRPFLK